MVKAQSDSIRKAVRAVPRPRKVYLRRQTIARRIFDAKVSSLPLNRNASSKIKEFELWRKATVQGHGKNVLSESPDRHKKRFVTLFYGRSSRRLRLPWSNSKVRPPNLGSHTQSLSTAPRIESSKVALKRAWKRNGDAAHDETSPHSNNRRICSIRERARIIHKCPNWKKDDHDMGYHSSLFGWRNRLQFLSRELIEKLLATKVWDKKRGGEVWRVCGLFNGTKSPTSVRWIIKAKYVKSAGWMNAQTDRWSGTTAYFLI